MVPNIAIAALTSEVPEFRGQLGFEDTLVDRTLAMRNMLADAELYVRNAITAGLDENGHDQTVDVVLGHILNNNSERLDGGHSEIVAHLIFLICLDDLGYEAL
jgi:hypothetical protein